MNYSRSDSEKINLNKYLISEGVIGGSNMLGKTFEEIVEEKYQLKDEKEDFNENEEDDENPIIVETEEERRKREELEYEERVTEIIKRSREKGIISKNLERRLLEKYMNKELRNYNSLEDLFLNCMNEVALGTIKSGLMKGSENFLKKEDYVKVFLAPTHFGGAQGFNQSGSKNIKDRKVNAEIDSINGRLSSLISSGNLSVSKKFLNILRSNYKLWVNVVRGTNYKRENKKFLIILFLTIINSSQVFEESNHDYIWQDMINLYTPYIADDGPEDEEGSDFFDFDTSVIAGSRLIYKVSGF
jgi:hypothetical protein